MKVGLRQIRQEKRHQSLGNFGIRTVLLVSSTGGKGSRARLAPVPQHYIAKTQGAPHEDLSLRHAPTRPSGLPYCPQVAESNRSHRQHLDTTLPGQDGVV
jgi:hypothetical protein